MRVAFQVVAVLEGARLALVGIDRHEARAGKAAHDLPLLAGREAGAAEAAQAGVGEDLDELLRRPLVGEAGAQQLIAAVALVGSEVLVGGDRRAMVAGRGSHQALHRGVRSEEHTSELQSLMRSSYAVFCLKKKQDSKNLTHANQQQHML